MLVHFKKKENYNIKIHRRKIYVHFIFIKWFTLYIIFIVNIKRRNIFINLVNIKGNTYKKNNFGLADITNIVRRDPTTKDFFFYKFMGLIRNPFFLKKKWILYINGQLYQYRIIKKIIKENKKLFRGFIRKSPFLAFNGSRKKKLRRLKKRLRNVIKKKKHKKNYNFFFNFVPFSRNVYFRNFFKFKKNKRALWNLKKTYVKTKVKNKSSKFLLNQKIKDLFAPDDDGWILPELYKDAIISTPRRIVCEKHVVKKYFKAYYKGRLFERIPYHVYRKSALYEKHKKQAMVQLIREAIYYHKHKLKSPYVSLKMRYENLLHKKLFSHFFTKKTKKTLNRLVKAFWKNPVAVIRYIASKKFAFFKNKISSKKRNS